jgi:hypothetical protein
MERIAIVTLTGYFNFGNRLQNYALAKVLQDKGFEVYTVWNKGKKERLKDAIKCTIPFKNKYKRFKIFRSFSRKFLKEITLNDIQKRKIKKIVVGSDQVWNPKYYEEDNSYLYNPKYGESVYSYAASLGTSKLEEKYHEVYRDTLKKYEKISVREKSAEEELKKVVGRDDIITVVDPTLLVKRESWSKIEKRPKHFDENKKYILKYFLGEISEEEQESISKFALENNYEIIDILDENDNAYVSGPEEFLYLIDHSVLVCTDSFHSCVFSFIFDKPFTVFKRKGCSDYMYSRIENLLSLFSLKNREYTGKITIDSISHDYSKGYKVLEQEQKKSGDFLCLKE